MVKKVIDNRIPQLIRNGVQERKRSFFVVVGDRGKDVVLNLHYILSNVDPKQNKSVLWAYKHKLAGFTSHRKKREAKIKKEVKRGIREANAEDPFELFLTLTPITYCFYKETERILGNTYGTCIIQDFESITPNLMARTIETVEGGGLVILLLKSMKSLKQMYTMTMDVHSRYRTEAHGDVVARFNERFILSLSDCASCLVIDDELNILPVSGGRYVEALPAPSVADNAKTPLQNELEELKEGLADVQPAGCLVSIAKTVDQAKAIMMFIDAIAEKTLRSTVALTAGRGRGKSAALGISIAAAVAHGYSNIFITSPSPENLKTLFEFIFKGFDALSYADHLDYDIIQSTNPTFNKAIVRVNIHKRHRQTIQYIQPEDAHVLGQAELVIIDEAAAIPLPLVQKLMGPYLIFMASTINGYEGTGRSLSLKLLQQLRDQSRGLVKSTTEGGVTADRSGNIAKDVSRGSKNLREAALSEPIRYAPGDPVEKWLNTLLCLDATLPPSKKSHLGAPSPLKCDLYSVSRDTLFSYHPVSERFLQKMMALYVASHYKNSPNDLQLMSDAPAHQLFVLLPPKDEESKQIPDPLVVIQVALEGQISKQSVQAALNRGKREGGDMIPWLVSQQFQDPEFASLSGARIVRIATNPDYARMGYGARALELLTDFYEGKFSSIDETASFSDNKVARVTDADLEASTLHSDNIKVRDSKALPPLLNRLCDTQPDVLDYLGVSYGLTPQLHRFWKKVKFAPVYLRQTATDLTGEHSCVMLKTLADRDSEWLASFTKDFKKRFLELLSYEFRKFPALNALGIIESSNLVATGHAPALTKPELDALLSPFDLKRLESYADNMLDYHVILDMVPQIAHLHFTGRLKSFFRLSGLQELILMAVGCQRKSLEDIEKEMPTLKSAQTLALFQKVIRKVATAFKGLLVGDIAGSLPAEDAGLRTNGVDMRPLEAELAEELREAGTEALEDLKLKNKKRELINGLDLAKYEIGEDAEWGDAERQVSKGKGNTVSVKTKRSKRKAGEATAEEVYEEEMTERKSKKHKKKQVK